jgi:hypothetical protein
VSALRHAVLRAKGIRVHLPSGPWTLVLACLETIALDRSVHPLLMTGEIIDMSKGEDVGTNVRQVKLRLAAPQARLRLGVGARRPGRAEAIFGGKSWAAKHYWEEEQGIWVYEFDDALPAGEVVLRVTVAGA